MNAISNTLPLCVIAERFSFVSDEELHIKLDVLTTSDVEAALATTKPSASALSGKYAAWQKDYESV